MFLRGIEKQHRAGYELNGHERSGLAMNYIAAIRTLWNNVGYPKCDFDLNPIESTETFNNVTIKLLSFWYGCAIALHWIINKLHERTLWLAYDDRQSTFEKLVNIDKSATIHHMNLQVLATELYMVHHELPLSCIMLQNGQTYFENVNPWMTFLKKEMQRIILEINQYFKQEIC